ncbi:hypothetical protein ACIA03_29205 [Nocardioides sp. NPDC051685]|uniref:hypothetical protein n=1 Tax=Nocardioides sp. NPDC051685 TaxID=3364334 RepID=UPI0037B014FA
MPDPTDETSAETSGLVDDLATVLEDTGVRVEELIEELLEAVDLAETIAAALQGGERDEMAWNSRRCPQGQSRPEKGLELPKLAPTDK